MFARNCAVLSILSLVFALSGSSSAGPVKEQTVLVVPGRPATVAVAVDVARLRKDVSVVLYQFTPKTKVMVMHVWDARRGDWVKTTLEDYANGSVPAPGPKRIVLIGPESDTPAALEKTYSWGEASRIPTLNIMNLVNSLNQILTFAPGEWRYLARRHDLKLKDLNEERRRYGRFGKPGEKPAVPGEAEVTTTTSTSLGPVEIIPEKPVVAPVTTATSPEDK